MFYAFAPSALSSTVWPSGKARRNTESAVRFRPRIDGSAVVA